VYAIGTATAGSGIVAGAMANAGAMGSSAVGGTAVGANSGPSAAGLGGSAIHRFINQRFF